jgi:RNA polymerase sigma-70 factor (ECF subfamily)
MKTPVSLLQRLRESPDPEAWSRFVHLYLPLVCYWGRLYGLQDADVADLSQEVFALLLRKLPEFCHDGHGSFRAWLRAVTLNKWRELCRRRPQGREEGALPGELASADPAGATWESEHNQYLAARALKLMQADFDETTWRACWETAVEGRAAAEVARQLGLTPAAVYCARSRVLRRLRDELRDLL